MSDAPDPKKLEALERRLGELKQAHAPKPRAQSHEKQVAAGWRMVIDLVVGMAMGFGIGYGLDYLFGTLPIFLILFTLLGFAAGVRAMMRSANELQEEELRRQASAKDNAQKGKDEGR